MNKKIIPIICLFPLIAGTVGYLMCGEMITDAIYAGFALYFTNPVSDAYNGYIEFARWTAPPCYGYGNRICLKERVG